MKDVPEAKGAPEVEEKPNKTNPMSPEAPRPTALWSAVRALTLAGATLTTGLIAGVFYAYAVSVNLGLAAQPDAAYIATMQAINERIQNPLFFLSFFGAVLFLMAALVVYSPRPRSGRFWLIALACVLYVGGGFLLTVFVNVPLNVELLERRARGIRVARLPRPRMRLPPARGPSVADGFAVVAINCGISTHRAA